MLILILCVYLAIPIAYVYLHLFNQDNEYYGNRRKNS